MVLSLIHPRACGFARGVAWQVIQQVDDETTFHENETRPQNQARKMRERFDRFLRIFESNKENFNIDYKGFQKILPDLRKKFSRWNPRKIEERNQYTSTFNIER